MNFLIFLKYVKLQNDQSMLHFHHTHTRESNQIQLIHIH